MAEDIDIEGLPGWLRDPHHVTVCTRYVVRTYPEPYGDGTNVHVLGVQTHQNDGVTVYSGVVTWYRDCWPTDMLNISVSEDHVGRVIVKSGDYLLICDEGGYGVLRQGAARRDEWDEWDEWDEPDEWDGPDEWDEW